VKNYFVYLPDNPGGGCWQCTATSAGYARIPPGVTYPPSGHPRDHDFTWEKGRILHVYQIILITEGWGWFESAPHRRPQRVEPGAVLLLFPGVWHRYGPDSEIGWVEHWIECRGKAFDRAVKSGLIRPEEPLLRVGPDPNLLRAFEQGHEWMRENPLANQALLSTLGLQMLAMIDRLRGQQNFPKKRVEEQIQKVQAYILEHHASQLDMRQVAAKNGLSYSHLRQNFKRLLGVGPKHYQNQIRLQRAQDILANTSKSIKEVSEILGFHSPFHFSAQFKAAFGVSPRFWRSQLRR